MKIPDRPPTGRDFREAVARHQRWVKERLKDPAVQAEIETARAEAAAAARLLKERFGATRVRLFGSLARLDQAEGFDIDLAVEGIKPEVFFEAWGQAGLLVTRELDIVDVCDAPPLLRKYIEMDGIDLS